MLGKFWTLSTGSKNVRSCLLIVPPESHLFSGGQLLLINSSLITNRLQRGMNAVARVVSDVKVKKRTAKNEVRNVTNV